jgi:hypothetical protein
LRETLKARTRLIAERRKLRITHAPTAVELLNNELAI